MSHINEYESYTNEYESYMDEEELNYLETSWRH